MPTMKCILIRGDKSDSADDLYMGERERPVPKENECLIKVKAFGLNRMDIMQRKGQYPLPPGVTDILGVEFSGVVEQALSNGQGKYKVGDEVFGLAFGGAYAEYIPSIEGMLTLKPKEVSWVDAAAIPENWLTAYQALYLIADKKSEQSVLIHAGASGVGLAAIQLARSFGSSKIYATAGTDDKIKFCEQHGADKAINYKTSDFSKEIAQLTDGKGVDIVIDFVGQSYWDKNINSLARDGRMVLLGLMSGAQTEGPLNMAPILFKRLRIEGTALRSRTVEYQSRLLQEFSSKAMDKLLGDGLDLVIHKVFDWKDVAEAHKEMEGAKNIGKIICEIR